MLVESLLDFAQAAELFPTQPHVSTLFRWATRGSQGVTLRTVRLGRQRFTTREWVDDFIRALAGIGGDPEGSESTSADVDERLQAAGLK